MSGGLVDMRAAVAPRWRDMAGRFEDPDKAVDREFYTMGQVWGSRAVRRLQAATPVKTGATQRAWRSEYVPTERAVKVSNRRAQAAYLIRGTPPHNIPGAFGYPAPFGVGGRFSSFFHPGQRPDEELVGALERVQEDAVVDFSDTGTRLMRRLVTGS